MFKKLKNIDYRNIIYCKQLIIKYDYEILTIKFRHRMGRINSAVTLLKNFNNNSPTEGRSI